PSRTAHGTRRLNSMVVGPGRATPPPGPPKPAPGLPKPPAGPLAAPVASVVACSETSSHPAPPRAFRTWIFWLAGDESFLNGALSFSASSSHPFRLRSSAPVVQRTVAPAGTAGVSLPSLSLPAGRSGVVRKVSSAYSHLTA